MAMQAWQGEARTDKVWQRRQGWARPGMARKCRKGMKVQTKYKLSKRLKGDATAIVAHLEGLAKQAPLTAIAVVADAKKKSSPLHDLFCWDDTEAARLYREDQARFLIRSVIRVTVRGDEYADLQTRAFVNVTVADERQYVSIATAMNNPDLRNQLLENALRDLAYFERKYKELSELTEVFAVIRSMRARAEPIPQQQPAQHPQPSQKTEEAYA